MIDKRKLAVDALSKALKLRSKLNINLTESVSAIEVAEMLGLEVRLVDIPSMEGMYISGSSPKIILSNLRPQGRMNFTCAHEIGHHIYGHGEEFDEITSAENVARKNDPKEFSADCFAGFFLMPKATIDSGMKLRDFKYETLEPHQVYALSSWLGVGYSTLVKHMQFGIKMISSAKKDQLLHYEPQEIRQQIFADSVKSNLHVVDDYWIGRAIDCEVGDYLSLPKNTSHENERLEIVKSGDKEIYLAKSPGIGKVTNSILNKSWFVRVSTKSYAGRGCYRFEEEVE